MNRKMTVVDYFAAAILAGLLGVIAIISSPILLLLLFAPNGDTDTESE